MSVDAFISVVVIAIVFAPMFYLGLQSDETMRANYRRMQERVQKRAEDRTKYGGSGFGLAMCLIGAFLLLAKFSPAAATAVSIYVLMFWLSNLLSRDR